MLQPSHIMLSYNPIAGKPLHQPLSVVISSNPLVGSEALPAVSLLNSYMDIIICASRKQVIPCTCISKGVGRGSPGK